MIVRIDQNINSQYQNVEVIGSNDLTETTAHCFAVDNGNGQAYNYSLTGNYSLLARSNMQPVSKSFTPAGF